MDRLSASSVIAHTRSIFARHGVPELVISDNGPQFASEEYASFAKEYGFEHVTSSPLFPQANGEAERAVRTVKNLLKKSPDPYFALLVYRSTPLEVGYSPSKLLMGRNLRTNIPTIREQRVPKTPDFSVVVARDEREKRRQKENFDAHHGARELPTLSPGDTVWCKDRQSPAQVVEETAPRSYVIQTPEGTYRRNRRHVVATPGEESINLPDNVAARGPPPEEDSPPNVTMGNEDEGTSSPKVYETRSRSGRAPQPLNRLDNSWT